MQPGKRHQDIGVMPGTRCDNQKQSGWECINHLMMRTQETIANPRMLTKMVINIIDLNCIKPLLNGKEPFYIVY